MHLNFQNFFGGEKVCIMHRWIHYCYNILYWVTQTQRVWPLVRYSNLYINILMLIIIIIFALLDRVLFWNCCSLSGVACEIWCFFLSSVQNLLQDDDVFISTHIKCEKCCYFRNIVGWDTDLSSFVEDVEVRKYQTGKGTASDVFYCTK